MHGRPGPLTHSSGHPTHGLGLAHHNSGPLTVQANLRLRSETLAGNYKSPLDMTEVLSHDGRPTSLVLTRPCH